MERPDFVLLRQQHWDLALGTNARNVARELAHYHRVLYVNRLLDVGTLTAGLRQPAMRQRLRQLWQGTETLTQPEPNLWVLTPDCLALSINWLRWWAVFARINILNTKRLSRRVGLEKPALLLDGLAYPGIGLKRLLRPSQFIYYLRDHMISAPYLAMGRPVVATRTRTMELFADYAYLAANCHEWLAQLAQVLVFPAERAARCVAFAQSHTWPASVDKLCEAMRTASAMPVAEEFATTPTWLPAPTPLAAAS